MIRVATARYDGDYFCMPCCAERVLLDLRHNTTKREGVA